MSTRNHIQAQVKEHGPKGKKQPETKRPDEASSKGKAEEERNTAKITNKDKKVTNKDTSIINSPDGEEEENRGDKINYQRKSLSSDIHNNKSYGNDEIMPF